jgi:hypothetical protein
VEGAVAARLPAPPGPARDGDPSGAVLRHAAHLRIETPADGDLELHLRIREGVAHLRVDGEAAGLVEAQAGELARALQGQGLRLGSLDLPQPEARAGGEHPAEPGLDFERGGRERGAEPDDPAPRPPPQPRRPTPAPRGGVHVRA